MRQWIEEINQQKHNDSSPVEEIFNDIQRNDPEGVQDRWRENLELEYVSYIQEKCSSMMEELGYIPVTDKSTMKNISIKLVDFSKEYSYYPPRWRQSK